VFNERAKKPQKCLVHTNTHTHACTHSGSRDLRRYSDSLRDGWSGDRISVGRFSALLQTGPEAHPASYTVGTRVFPGGKAAGAWR